MKNNNFDDAVAKAYTDGYDVLQVAIEEQSDIQIDLEKVKENAPQFSNEKLCEMIVCDRYFGFDKKVSSICMEELAKRRIAGDNFKFEDYIENSRKQLPDINFKGIDLRTVLKKAMSSNWSKK